MTKVFYRPGAPTPFGVAASAVLIEVPGGDQADLAAVFSALPPGQTISASLNGAGIHESVYLAWEGVTEWGTARGAPMAGGASVEFPLWTFETVTVWPEVATVAAASC